MGIRGLKTWDDAQTWFGSAGATSAGSYSSAGAWTIGGASGTQIHQVNGNSLRLDSVGDFFGLITNTSDGSDTKGIRISGGGAASLTRGGLINLFGNEHATQPGALEIAAGTVTNAAARIDFYTNGAIRGAISNTGDTSWGPSSGGATHTFTGGSGAVELSIHSTNAGSTAANLRLRNSSGASNDVFQITHGGGVTKFRDGGNTTIGQVDLTSVGVWTFGHSSSTVGTHSFLINAASQAVLSLRNFDTTTGSDASQALTIIKGSTTNTTSQNFIVFTINAGATNSGKINANGASQAAFGTFSDSRLKQNIVDLPSQLDNIMALRPVEFDYIDGSGHQVGFIAQEMQTVYPDAVSAGTEPEAYLQVTGWSKTEARLVKALQELKQQFDDYVAAHP